MSNIKKSETILPSVFSDLFDYDKFFGGQLFKNFQNSFPAVNVKETDKDYKIDLAVPGFKKEDIDVHMHKNVLHIVAENKSEKSEENEKYTRKEFSSSSFSRMFQLPESANDEKIEAKYEDGVLKITVDKKTESVKLESKKKIDVK